MAELSQLTFIASGAIVVTGLLVVATIPNGLTRLQMTPGTNRTWKPLYEVREASWKRKRQGIILLSTGELKWKNKSVPEFMGGAQRVHSKVTSDLGRWKVGKTKVDASTSSASKFKCAAVAFRCRHLSWKMSKCSCQSCILSAYVWFLLENRKQGQKFETRTPKQTICDTFWDKTGNGNVTCTGF